VVELVRLELSALQLRLESQALPQDPLSLILMVAAVEQLAARVHFLEAEVPQGVVVEPQTPPPSGIPTLVKVVSY
jgi:hypothetical protein